MHLACQFSLAPVLPAHMHHAQMPPVRKESSTPAPHPTSPRAPPTAGTRSCWCAPTCTRLHWPNWKTRWDSGSTAAAQRIEVGVALAAQRRGRGDWLPTGPSDRPCCPAGAPEACVNVRGVAKGCETACPELACVSELVGLSQLSAQVKLCAVNNLRRMPCTPLHLMPGP